MKKIFVSIGLVVVLLLGGSAYIQKKFPSGSWRYRMVVVVETPEGEKVGQAVRQVNAQRSISILRDNAQRTYVSAIGEAVVVDLGKYGYLFALMDSEGSHRIVYQEFAGVYSDYSRRLDVEGIKRMSNLHLVFKDKKQQVDVSDFYFPQLVMFKDLNDIATLEEVLLRKIVGRGRAQRHEVASDRFEELFGEGVKLKEIYIQMTDDPISVGIDTVLPWLNKGWIERGVRPNGSKSYERLYTHHFKRGIK